MIFPALLACLLGSAAGNSNAEKAAPPPHFDYEAAQPHELKPHRRTIPLEGVQVGFNQLHLFVTVSPTGDVIEAEAGEDKESVEFWPQVRDEVYQWKFTPFEAAGKPVTAEVEEYVDLVPPERLPKTRIKPPAIRLDSRIAITLRRTGCFGSCPAYSVTLTTQGIVFDGNGFVVAAGKHTATFDPNQVRELARKFIAADFYSMNPEYVASVTDCSTYLVSIDIDGKLKQIQDYMGSWVGMPAIISELEDDVDELAGTNRWIKGTEGLVSSLQAEHYNFKTFDAQVTLKEAAQRGQEATVEEFLEAGVPLSPLPAPQPKTPYQAVPFEHVGWLTAASNDPKTLQYLIDARLSQDDQADKNLALVNATTSGNLESVRALIGYGAKPNADLGKLTVTNNFLNMTMTSTGSGTILIYAAGSGNPDVVREILQYHPPIEARDSEGKTALFTAGNYRSSDKDGDRAKCVLLLIQAGANVNARDKDGNTPLHKTFLTDIQEDLLKFGADVNARNNDGETPIFVTINDSAIPLYLKNGADLTIRNNKGQTVLEAASGKGPLRQEALRKAIQSLNETPATAPTAPIAP